MNSFDLTHWQRVFPWESIRDEADDSGTHITSPVHLVMIEKQREQIANDLSKLHNLPTEVFTFSLGEPDDPAATKIGGVPFRQHDKPWPQYSGYNYEFLAQFNFTNSRDLVGGYPRRHVAHFCEQRFL